MIDVLVPSLKQITIWDASLCYVIHDLHQFWWKMRFNTIVCLKNMIKAFTSEVNVRRYIFRGLGIGTSIAFASFSILPAALALGTTVASAGASVFWGMAE